MQSGQLPKMNKPPYANTVKEVTYEEAKLLRSLGVTVCSDYDHYHVGWDDFYDEEEDDDFWESRWVASCGARDRFFFVPLEDSTSEQA